MGRIVIPNTFVWLLTLVISHILIEATEAEEQSNSDSSNSNAVSLSAIVVTGTRTEKSVFEAPVRTEVVSRQEIEKTHARDLKEALEDVPGLMLKPNEKNGFVAWLQGMDANRVLVVINGEPVSPSTGSSVDLTQIGTMDIERIEIVKGATSALYGSNALGGVINIITRKPSKSLAYQLSVDGGSYGDKNLSGKVSDITARRLAANLSIKKSIGYLQLNADLRDKDGYDLDPNTFRSEGAAGSKANVNLRMAWTPDDKTEIFFAPRYYQEKTSNNISTFAPGVGEIKKKKNEEATRVSATLGAERQFDDGGQVRGWLFRENWQDVTQQDVIITQQIDQQRTAEIDLSRAELQWDKPVGEKHLLTYGLVFRKETLNQYTTVPNQTTPPEVDNKEKEVMEAYFQDDIFVNDQWELVPGIRLQNDNRFGFYAAPKINAMFTPEWIPGVITNVRMGIGRGYRSPDLKEQYYIFDHSQLGYMVLGSPDLQPESSDSYQLGIEFARPGKFRADITLFHNRIKNLIDTRRNPEKSAQTGLQIFEYENFAQALTQGIELSGNLYLGVFDLKGSYTLLDSEDRITGKTLKERPRHMIKLGADYLYRPWGTNVTLRSVYQSKEFYDADNLRVSPAWATWDLKLTQTITHGIKLFGGIDNLTDEHRDPGLYYDNRPASGRLFYLGFKVEK